MSRKQTKVLTLDDETDFAYTIIAPLEHHYFKYEKEKYDDEISEQEVNDVSTRFGQV